MKVFALFYAFLGMFPSALVKFEFIEKSITMGIIQVTYFLTFFLIISFILIKKSNSSEAQ